MLLVLMPVLVLSLWPAPAAWAEPNSSPAPDASAQRPRIGLVLSGGGSLIPGLAEQLAMELQIEVKHPDPFNVSPKHRSEFVKHGAKYMTALGLALRSFVPCQI